MIVYGVVSSRPSKPSEIEFQHTPLAFEVLEFLIGQVGIVLEAMLWAVVVTINAWAWGLI